MTKIIETINKHKFKLIKAISFVFILFLCFLFPYSGDDWTWGSIEGIKRLNNFFDNYNGRYLGNLLVLLLTRFSLLKIFVVAITTYGIILLLSKLSNKNENSLFLVACLLMLCIPKGILRQTIVWTSGYANYVISAFLVLLYLYLLKIHIPKEEKIKNILQKISLGLIGFCLMLFIEHITLYIIGITFLFLLKDLIVDKKLSTKYIVVLIGAIIGAFLMFSNSAYMSILNNKDSYRDVPNSSSSLIEKVKTNSKIIYKELAFNNTFLNIFLCLLVSIIVYKYLKDNVNISKKKKFILNISYFSIIGFVLYMIASLLNPNWKILLKFTPYFEFLFTIIYCLSLLFVLCLCLNKEKAEKILFYRNKYFYFNMSTFYFISNRK